MILQVGRVARLVRLDEGAELGGRHGHRAAPRQCILRGETRTLDEALEALVHGLHALDLVGAADLQMVLQVLAHALQLVRYGDADSRSTSPGPMPESCRICGEPMAPAASTTSRARMRSCALRRPDV